MKRTAKGRIRCRTRIGMLGGLVTLCPSALLVQEVAFGSFDAAVTAPQAGTTSYPGWAVEGSIAVPGSVPLPVFARYNRDYGSPGKPTTYTVPSLQMGAAVRVVSAGSVRAYLRLGAIRAYLETRR